MKEKMHDNFENHIHLDPEMTWEDTATFIYDALIEGKLTREDFIKFFNLSGKEMVEPRHARILGKALATFFKDGYQDLPVDQIPGVFVIVDGKKYIVSHNNKEITIEEANDVNEEDGSFLISHESEADAKIEAWKNKEKYVERL